jgi:hypothetical protein
MSSTINWNDLTMDIYVFVSPQNSCLEFHPLTNEQQKMPIQNINQ